jgi:WXXGXW repeat (2 copies)
MTLSSRHTRVLSLAAWIFAFTVALVAIAQVPPPPGPTLASPTPGDPPNDEPGVETLTQGPIHEAFANPADLDPTPGPAIPKKPPADVPEDPPEYMPEGAIWIPGYWIWDDDRDDFVWVTGVARVPPPGQRWVPGYFAETDGGFQRVSGFWVNNDMSEVEYRDEAPPATLETGPSSPAPTENHFWIPGSWNYQQTAGYRWQAGYWAPYQPNWIWVPARWAWTPAGFVYIPGFWDYTLAYRGQMFAPIYFQQPLYAQPGWFYRPWLTIPTNNLFIHLWLRPAWGSYYFGNYYGAPFANRGFVPWANITVVNQRRYIYDPFYSYAHVHYRRQNINYLERVQGWHRYYNDHADLRPARTWHEQQGVVARGGAKTAETQLVGRQISEVARSNDAPVRLARLDEQARRAQKQHAEKIRDFHNERSRIERGQVAARTGPRADTPGETRDVPRPKTAEGKAGPKLSLPKADLPLASRSVARNQQGGDNRPGAGSPPPRPTPRDQARDDRGSKGGGDRGSKTASDDRGSKGGGDRGSKGGDRSVADDRPGDRGGKTAKTGDADNDRPRGGDNTPGRGRGNDSIGRNNNGKTGDLPQVDRPGPAGDLPRVDSPTRETPPAPGSRPAAKTPGVVPPNDLPGNRRPTPKVDPGSRNDIPRAKGKAESPGKSKDTPRVNPQPGKATTPRADVPRNNLPGERAGNDGPRGGQPNNAGPRVDAQRPTFSGPPSPAPTPKAQPRPEPRPMPRVESPRENRPAPRNDPPRPSPNLDKGGGPQRGNPQADRSSDSTSSNGKGGGKTKGKSRDND